MELKYKDDMLFLPSFHEYIDIRDKVEFPGHEFWLRNDNEDYKNLSVTDGELGIEYHYNDDFCVYAYAILRVIRKNNFLPKEFEVNAVTFKFIKKDEEYGYYVGLVCETTYGSARYESSPRIETTETRRFLAVGYENSLVRQKLLQFYGTNKEEILKATKQL